MTTSWHLRILQGNSLYREFSLEYRTYTIGRSRDNDIVVDGKNISRFHGRFYPAQGGWVYEDLNSRNGTFVQGRRIHRIQFEGALELLLGSRHPERAIRLLFSPMVATPDAAPSLEQEGWYTTGYMLSHTYEPVETSTSVLLGRHPRADIRLDSPVVSRRHARLVFTPQGWMLEDLNSTNGTFVNGVRIRRPVLLHRGDLIQIGSYRLIYQGQGQVTVLEARRGLRIDGINLEWRARDRIILHNIHISCHPQQFVALVGGSGAGKSTLMKVLSGYLPPTRGRVWISGDDLYKNFGLYRRQFGYVPQDDILHTDLTVWNALWYAAKLRLPPDLDDQEIAKRIQHVLEQVELTGQRHNVISTLSGGQRKRASIAVELLADPPVLFLDEPTSGLDPGLERKMMHMLRNLADTGKTVILITHATSNITQCHMVAFLSQGRLVYYGPPKEALKFFQAEDFATIYEKISAPNPQDAQQRAEAWRRRFERSPLFKTYIKRPLQDIQQLAGRSSKAVPDPSPPLSLQIFEQVRQFGLLTQRYVQLIWRDRILTFILAGIMPFLAALIRLIAKPHWLQGESRQAIEEFFSRELAQGAQSAFYSVAGNAQALLFMMALASILLGLFSSAYEVVKERHIYQRERMVFLGLLPYLLSKMVVLSALAAVNVLVFLFILGGKVDFPKEGVFLPAPVEMYITLVLAAVAAIALGLFLSSAAPNSNAVVYLILGVLFGQILFAGTIFKLPGPAKSISYLTLTRWTIEALGISVNLEGLNQLSQTRFLPGEITETVTFTVEKPDPNWEPIEIIMEKRSFPFCSQPIDYPVIRENEMQTVEEEVTKEVTLTPEPITLKTPMSFILQYERSLLRLIERWWVLSFFALVFFVASLISLKRRDVV